MTSHTHMQKTQPRRIYMCALLIDLFKVLS